MYINVPHYLSVTEILRYGNESATKFVHAVLAQIQWYRCITLEDKIRERYEIKRSFSPS